MARNRVLSAVASCPAVQDLAASLPAPGSRSVLGGALGSLAPIALAALHRARPERVFVAVAESLGCAAVRVNNRGDIKAAVDAVDKRRPGQTVFIEARLDPDMVSGLPR